MRAAPAVSCASRTTKCAHEHTGPAENTRPSLRNGFTAYIVVVLVRRALLPPSLRRNEPVQLDASFGRRTLTTLPYASAALVFATSASTASHRAFVTCARPSLGWDGRSCKSDLPDAARKILPVVPICRTRSLNVIASASDAIHRAACMRQDRLL